MWFITPRDGDWIRVIRPFTESGLLPTVGRVNRGQRGVVIDDRASGVFTPRILVRIDTVFGLRDVRAPVNCVRVTHRGRGSGAFDDRAALWRWVRIGAFASMTVPLLVFVAHYWWSTGSLEGIVGQIAVGVVQQLFDFVEYLLTRPVQAVAFVAVSWLVGRIAFGRRLL